jgi:putative hemolysin
MKAAGHSMAAHVGKTEIDPAAMARALWPPPVDGRHIVDVLLEERAPRLMRSAIWPLVRGPLFALLEYRGARESADAIADKSGRDALAYVSGRLRLHVCARGLERIPLQGPCVIVANHPTGIADGVALSDALLQLRPDHCFFANADALRVCPRFSEIFIPVEWMKERRTVEKTKVTLKLARRALAEGRAVVIFPAGAPARRIGLTIKEPPWEPSAISLARKHAAPVIPVHISGPCSHLYHAFGLVSRELRNVTLFRELLNKAGKRYDVWVGPPISGESLKGEAEALSRRLRRYVVHTLAHAPDAPFA